MVEVTACTQRVRKCDTIVAGYKPVKSHPARVAEWQTRATQNRQSERTWGFDSPLGHPK